MPEDSWPEEELHLGTFPGSTAIGSLRGPPPHIPDPPHHLEHRAWSQGYAAGYDRGRAEAFEPDPRPLSGISGLRRFTGASGNPAELVWRAYVEARVRAANRGQAVEAVVVWESVPGSRGDWYVVRWTLRARRKGEGGDGDTWAEGVPDDGHP